MPQHARFLSGGTKMEYAKRKHPRLKQYDYDFGVYFVTICTQDRKCVLSDIDVGRGLAPAVKVRLTPYGAVAQEQLLALESRYPSVYIDRYVIMPNHIHILICFTDTAAGASPRPTLPDVICAYKSITTRLCKQIRPISKLFQTSYYDHVIRGETDYLEIVRYIDNNPAKWTEDELYIP